MVKVLVLLEFAEVEVKRGKLWRIDQSLKTQTAVQQSEETSHSSTGFCSVEPAHKDRYVFLHTWKTFYLKNPANA